MTASDERPEAAPTDILAVADWLAAKRAKAITAGTGVNLTWQDAEGLVVLLRTVAGRQ